MDTPKTQRYGVWTGKHEFLNKSSLWSSKPLSSTYSRKQALLLCASTTIAAVSPLRVWLFCKELILSYFHSAFRNRRTGSSLVYNLCVLSWLPFHSFIHSHMYRIKICRILYVSQQSHIFTRFLLQTTSSLLLFLQKDSYTQHVLLSACHRRFLLLIWGQWNVSIWVVPVPMQSPCNRWVVNTVPDFSPVVKILICSRETDDTVSHIKAATGNNLSKNWDPIKYFFLTRKSPRHTSKMIFHCFSKYLFSTYKQQQHQN